ncbi:MAG TPA: sigma-70 family RNA polymerase sigma factor [Fibrobacteria bacterium]|jgi:RNA polymerase sigma factor (sigma-70 family)|nr:sigma-70 family RNA polymerase sigma factor [Fibrobacteria bacterium]
MEPASLRSEISPDIFRERLRELCQRHHGLVRRACNRYVQNPDDADDLAQEVLLKAARAWGGFQGDCAAPTWLYRVAANHCADHLRRQRRRLGLLRLHAAEMAAEGSPEGLSEGGEESEAAALRRVLDALRGRLAGADRHIAYLRFEVGLRQRPIALATGLTRAGVAGRLRKIRDRAERLYREEMAKMG